MGFSKFGRGEVLPPEDHQKTASREWTPDDTEALRKENDRADSAEEQD